jgi:hypothetical protein
MGNACESEEIDPIIVVIVNYLYITATSWTAFGSNAMLGRMEHAPVYAAMR